MEDALKLCVVLIALALVLVYSTGLVNSFTGNFLVRLSLNDLNSFSSVMKSLRGVGSEGSWKSVNLRVPDGYSFFFNNYSDVLEVHGLEEFNISINADVVYSLNLSSGLHELEIYYGSLLFNETKYNMVVFR